MRINSQKVWLLVASAILRRLKLVPSARMTFVRPIRSAQGAPERGCVDASVKPVATYIYLQQEVGDLGAGNLLVHIKHHIVGKYWRGGFRFLDMQNAVFDRCAGCRARSGRSANASRKHRPPSFVQYWVS